jgi:hypothetical protein
VNRILTVVLSRSRARFFDVRPTGTEELACLFSAATRGGKFHGDRRDAPGRGEHAYHGRVREEERRHLAAVVERLAALIGGADATLEVVLAGPDDLIRAVERILTPGQRARLIGTLRIDPKRVTAGIIAREAKQLQQAWTELIPV